MDLGQFGESFNGLVDLAALFLDCRPGLTKRLPESDTAIRNVKLRGNAQASPLRGEQMFSPVMCTFRRTVTEPDKSLLAFRRRADVDEDALLFIFKPCLQLNAMRLLSRHSYASPPPLLHDRSDTLAVDQSGCRARSIVGQTGLSERLRRAVRRDSLQLALHVF